MEFIDIFHIALSIALCILFTFAFRSIIKEYKKDKEQKERIKKHQAYLLQQELSRIKIGDIYIETTSKPLWEKEIWQVTEILDKKGEGRKIYLEDCLSKYRERIVSDFELIESYKCENHIFDYDFAYGNKLLDGYISILEDLSERKAIIEAKVRDSQLKKTSKFIGKTGDEISDEDYYDYLDYIVYSGEQRCLEEENPHLEQ